MTKDNGSIADKDYLTVQDAALLLGFSVRTIRDMLKRDLIPYYRPYRKILIKKSDLYGYIEKTKVTNNKNSLI